MVLEGDAFEKALERLDERYGGDRRMYYTLMEEVERFRPIRLNEIKDIEALVRLLEDIVLHLEGSGKKEDLGSGFLYGKLLKKLPGKLLIKWEIRNTSTSTSTSCNKENAVKKLLIFLQEEALVMRRVIEI